MIANVLIMLSLFIVYNAYKMPVTTEYSTVINLYMITERQNALYLGGMLLLSGIILFVMRNIRRRGGLSNQNNKEPDKIDKSFQLLPIYKHFIGVDEGQIKIITRIAVGIVSAYYLRIFSSGVLMWLPYNLFVATTHYLIPIIVILYLLKNKPMIWLFNNVFAVTSILVLKNIVTEFFIANYHLHQAYKPPTSVVIALSYSLSGLILIEVFKNKYHNKPFILN